MTWEERGGPLIKGPPNREGFGGTLARKIVASQFRGRLSNEWNSSGLTIRIEIPLAHLNPTKDEPSRTDAAHAIPASSADAGHSPRWQDGARA